MEPNVFISNDEEGKIVIDDQSIWSARKTKTISLIKWNIIKLNVGTNKETLHFIGSDTFDNTGRISTIIQKMSIKKQTYVDDQSREHEIEGIGYSLSGTEYILIEKPGDLGQNATYILNRMFGKAIQDGRAELVY